MDNTFGAVLRNALAQRDQSMTSFAESLGISQAYVSMIVAGKRSPSTSRTIQIADYLGVDPGQMLVAAGKIPARIVADQALAQRRPSAV